MKIAKRFRAAAAATLLTAAVAADGFDWDDAAIGAGTGVAAVLLGAAGAHGVRSRHAAPRSSLSAPGT
jgi:hypothetical protein